MLVIIMKFWSSARSPPGLFVSHRRARHHWWDGRDKPRMTRAEMLIKCHTSDAHPSLDILYHVEVQLLPMELQLLLLPALVLIMILVVLILSWLLAAHRVTIIAVWRDHDNLFAMVVMVAIIFAVFLRCIFVVLMPARPLLQYFHLFLLLMAMTRRLLFSKTVHTVSSLL